MKSAFSFVANLSIMGRIQIESFGQRGVFRTADSVLHQGYCLLIFSAIVSVELQYDSLRRLGLHRPYENRAAGTKTERRCCSPGRNVAFEGQYQRESSFFGEPSGRELENLREAEGMAVPCG